MKLVDNEDLQVNRNYIMLWSGDNVGPKKLYFFTVIKIHLTESIRYSVDRQYFISCEGLDLDLFPFDQSPKTFRILENPRIAENLSWTLHPYQGTVFELTDEEMAIHCYSMHM